MPIVASDAALISALQLGQPGAPAMLVDRYGQYVERLLARVVGVDPELPDLIQDVFVQALTCLNDLKNPAAVKQWLGTLAVYTARAWIRRTRLRRRWVRFTSPDELPEMDATVPGVEINLALQRTYRLLEGLPTDERIAFALRFVEGMDLTDVAEVCGVSLSTVKRTLMRAEKRFTDAARKDPLLQERINSSSRWGGT